MNKKYLSPTAQQGHESEHSEELREPGVKETIREVKNATSAVQSTKETTESSYPSDLSFEEVQEFAKLGLSYEKGTGDTWLAVYKNPETGKISKFIYNPQAWIRTTPPELAYKFARSYKTFGRENLDNWFFNSGGKFQYQSTLTKHNLKLAEVELAITFRDRFGSKIQRAFGVESTGGSYPRHFRQQSGHDNGASLSLESDGYMDIYDWGAQIVQTGKENHKYRSLFLQVENGLKID